MTYLVSITSQGQISIPAEIRRKLGLDARQKAVVRQVGDEIVIKPAVDILSLKGSLKKYAKKGKSFEEIRKMERKAWENSAVERYRRSLPK